MSFKRKQARPQRANRKGKKAISESTVNSQRIGITLKLEAIKKNFFSSRSVTQSINQSINLHLFIHDIKFKVKSLCMGSCTKLQIINKMLKIIKMTFKGIK